MTCEYRKIEHLIYQYAEAIDRGDFSILAALFKKGSISYMPSNFTVKGGASMEKHFNDTVIIYADTGTPCTMHQITNVDVSIEDSGRRASANSVFVVYQILPDAAMSIICSGRYFDRFVNENGVWHFSERKVLPEYFGDLSQHIKDEIRQWRKSS